MNQSAGDTSIKDKLAHSHCTAFTERNRRLSADIHIAQVVFTGNELDQLQGHNDCQNSSGDSKDHVVGKGLDHGKNAAVPGLRGQADLTGDSLNLLIGSYSVPSSSTWAASPLQKPALAFLRLLAWAAPGGEW